VKAKYSGLGLAIKRILWIGLWIGGVWPVAAAQWSFLGPQWLCTDSVSGHAMVLNHARQVLVAATSLGAASVMHYDGAVWLPLGAGLPMSGQAECGMAMAPSDEPLVMLAPVLALYTLENGNWLPEIGLPMVANARNPRVLVAMQGDVRWLAWWQAGVADSTFVISDRGGSAWHQEGAFAGRLTDIALDEAGDPILLLQGAAALLRHDQGSWLSFPTFYHVTEQYLALVGMQDGTGDGVAVLRRDSSDALSVELFSNGNWLQLGPSGFATGDLASLAVSPTGDLHLLSVAHATQGLPQVLHYVAGTWQLVGGQAVYNNTVSQPMLAFDPGAAFALFQDDEQSHRNSVMYLGSPVEIGASHLMPTWTLSPNPAVDVLHLQWQHPLPGNSLRLCDAFGRECGRWEAGSASSMDLSVGHLAAGRYWIILQSPHRTPFVGSFIKT
jgi:hypothetical protein